MLLLWLFCQAVASIPLFLAGYITVLTENTLLRLSFGNYIYWLYREILKNRRTFITAWAKSLMAILLIALIIWLLFEKNILLNQQNPYATIFSLSAHITFLCCLWLLVVLVFTYFSQRVVAEIVVNYTGEWKVLCGNPESMPEFRKKLFEAKCLIGEAKAQAVLVTWWGLGPKVDLSTIPWPDEH